MKEGFPGMQASEILAGLSSMSPGAEGLKIDGYRALWNAIIISAVIHNGERD